MFPSEIQHIRDRIKEIDPIRYAKTRNYAEGKVTRLSPYISRGVISTRQLFDHLISLKLEWAAIEKLVQELAWRDYWQQIWIAKGNEINQDLRNTQTPVVSRKVPKNIVDSNTKITAVDNAISTLYECGYMHNHMRMYVASITCNVANAHWFKPAQWMYYHLLDGDWASNALSWQWVAGANANKKYYANQENINRFFGTSQQHTFLDVSYEDFDEMPIPELLKDFIELELNTELPISHDQLEDKKTLIYNYYILDSDWHAEEDYQRVLIFEPSFYRTYPVSNKCIEFVIKLSRNIPNIKLFVGEFHELSEIIKEDIIFKEHPTNTSYKGVREQREWLTNVTGYYPSFFKFWKHAKKQLIRE